MGKSVSIIGSGFSSIAASCYLAKNSYDVTVYEKNAQLGGRARQYVFEDFKFDMGPTWYWMPDVFDRFFDDFGKKTSDYYELTQLSPAYRVYFGKNEFVDIGSSIEKIYEEFEKIEPGSSINLKRYLKRARKNYEIAIKDLVYKPGISPLELVTMETFLGANQFITTIRNDIYRHVKSPKLRQILEFPVLFLGAKPSNTPLFYNFMNFADFGLGTWYPKGGMKSVIDGFVKLARELGVKFHTDSAVNKIQVDDKKVVKSIVINDVIIPVEILVSGADYKHTEDLLPKQFRSYSEKYWDRKIMSPSSLLFYVGFNKKIKEVIHHTLFFDSSFDLHASEIYDDPKWPENPLFYASFPSKSDNSINPVDKEAAIFLIPLAPDLADTGEIREKYFDIIIDRLENITNQKIRESILFKKSYCVNDFKEDYNSYKGNAYGLANTLMQTAFLRPKIKSNKVKNLYFTGQLTVPGPGVPPAIISGKLASELVAKNHYL